MTSIVLPSSLEWIGGKCLEGCDALTQILCFAVYPPQEPRRKFNSRIYESVTLNIPVGSKALYESEYKWKDFKNIIECLPVSSEVKISLNESRVEIEQGQTYQLTATVSPVDANNNNITWASSDNDIAEVSATGRVKAKAPGIAVITATCGESSSFCIVTISGSKGVEVKLAIKLKISQTLQLSALVDGIAGEASWSSTNSDIVEVSQDGMVTAKTQGTAIVTASCGENSATCIFTIDEQTNLSDIEADSNEVVVYNLSGIRLDIATRDELKQLPAGYYIVNNQIELVK